MNISEYSFRFFPFLALSLQHIGFCIGIFNYFYLNYNNIITSVFDLLTLDIFYETIVYHKRHPSWNVVFVQYWCMFFIIRYIGIQDKLKKVFWGCVFILLNNLRNKHMSTMLPVKNILFIFFVLILVIFAGCNSNGSSYTPASTPEKTPSTSNSYSPANNNPPTSTPTSTEFTFSPLPISGEVSEFTFKPRLSSEFINQNTTRLASAKSWVEFYWTDINGSYSAAKKSIPVSSDEVVVAGQPT
jgi:hypothetical protein